MSGSAPARAPRPRRSIVFISSLPDSVDEAYLRNLLGEENIYKVVLKHRERDGKRSNFAFATFNDEAPAKEAISSLNYANIDGNTIVLNWYDKEHRTKNYTPNTIVIKNLDENIEESGLHEALENIGEINHVTIPKYPDGKSKGYAYVVFKDPHHADEAVEQLKGAQIADREIAISKFDPTLKKGPEETFTNVFLKDLPPSVTDSASLEAMVRNLPIDASIQSSMIRQSQKPGTTPEGEAPVVSYFAFINFNNHEQALAFVNYLKENQIEGVQVYATRALSKQERSKQLAAMHAARQQDLYEKTKDRNLYFKNFIQEGDERTKEEIVRDMHEYFALFGEIESFNIPNDKKDPTKPNGYGFVCFKNVADAEKATLDAIRVKLYIAPFKPASVRVAEAANRNIAREHKAEKATTDAPAPRPEPQQQRSTSTKKTALLKRIKAEGGENKEALLNLAKSLNEAQCETLMKEDRLFNQWREDNSQ